MGRNGPSVPLFAVILASGWIAGTPVRGQDGERHALLVGVGQYGSRGVPPLPGAVSDVQVIRKVLASRHGFPVGSIRVLVDAEATREAVLESLRRLAAQAGPRDVVYIHFSGYGSQVKDLNGDERSDGLDETILPHDARTDGVADITDDDLAEVLSGIKASAVVIVLDASHAGTGTRGLQAVRERSAPPDSRLDLYERVRSRDVVPIEESHVLFGAAAAGQPALEVPVDGRVQGLFSYALSRTLARSPPGATPRSIFDGIKSELRRVQEQLGRRSMPRPQLEARWDLIDKSLFPAGARAGAGAERKAWLEVRPLSAKSAILVGGADMFGTKGSVWAIYPPGETLFRARGGVATGRVTQVQGNDALLEIVSRVKALSAIAPGSRAVPVASAPPEKVPVRLGRMTGDQREKLGGFLGKRLGALVEVAAEEQFARFVLDRGTEDGSSWELSDGTGLGPVQSFGATSLDDAAGKLEDFLKRSRNASELLALENLVSSLELKVEVYRPLTLGALQIGEKGIQLIADLDSPRYRIRKAGEPRSSENSLQLEIGVSSAAYITIVDVDAEGKVNILFPNDSQASDFHPDGLVPGGETILIPDSLESGNRARFFFDYSPPRGLDTVRVFAAADADTARRIREFALQINDELGAREEISALQGPETFSLDAPASLEAPISFREMQETLARPRGIIVVADTPETPEVIDPSLTLSPDLFDGGLASLEELTPSGSTPGLEGGLSTSLDGEPAAGGPGIPGDWTAVSITILVEE